MRNRVHHPVQAVHVGSYPYRLLLNPRINFRNRLDLRVHRFRVLSISCMKSVKVWILNSTHLRKLGSEKSPSFKSFFASSPVCFFERRYRVVIEAGPGVLPSVKVRHPVRNVDVDPIDSRARDLPHPLHVNLAPLAGIRASPKRLHRLS